MSHCKFCAKCSPGVISPAYANVGQHTAESIIKAIKCVHEENHISYPVNVNWINPDDIDEVRRAFPDHNIVCAFGGYYTVRIKCGHEQTMPEETPNWQWDV